MDDNSANSTISNKDTNNDIKSIVAPTDLVKQNIDNFGHENIPLMDMNRKVSNTEIDLSKGKEEYLNIGTTPKGIFEEKVKFKFSLKLSRPVFIIIIFFVIAIIGGGLFFYLTSTRKVAEKAVITKKLESELGDKLSLKLDDYATFNKIDPRNCILNVHEVDINKIGTYTYSIICGVNKYYGKVTIKDTKVPIVETKSVIKKIGETIDVSEFIISCTDGSTCSYELTNFDELTVNSNTVGMYSANILVKDESNNKTEINESYIVIANDIEKYLNCVSESLNLENYEGSYTINDSLGFVKNFNRIYYADLNIRTYTFAFSNKDEYQSIKSSIKNGLVDINTISGLAKYDDKKQTISISKMMSTNELTTEFSNFSDTLIGIKEVYENNNYTCKTQ